MYAIDNSIYFVIFSLGLGLLLAALPMFGLLIGAYNDDPDESIFHKLLFRSLPIGVIILCGVLFAYCYVFINQDLAELDRNDQACALVGKKRWVFSNTNYKYLKDKQGSESFVRLKANPYSVMTYSGEVFYCMSWDVGCAAHFYYKSGDLVLDDKPKLKIDTNSKIRVVLENGEEVVSHSYQPTKCRKYISRGRGDITCQEYQVRAEYNLDQYQQMMESNIDSVWIETKQGWVSCRVKDSNQAKLRRAIRSVYDETEYIQKVGLKHYDPQSRQYGNSTFNFFGNVTLLLLGVFGWLFPLVIVLIPYIDFGKIKKRFIDKYLSNY